MTTTSPEQVREGLQLVTTASLTDLATVTTAQDSAESMRSALFIATPAIVTQYAEAAATLAADWYQQIRDFAGIGSDYVPELVAPVREEYLGNAVAWATQALVDFEAEVERGAADILAKLEPVVQREVAAGFWDTITANVKDDPAAVGWKRIARPGACPFCRMLADKGAVYKADTATFAAHKSCHCVAAPEFGDAPEANVMQYVASSKRRSDAERARLREYLKKHYGA